MRALDLNRSFNFPFHELKGVGMSIVQISSTICHALVSLYESIAVHPRACAIIGAAGLVGIAATPPVPHNDPVRVLPSEPFEPVEIPRDPVLNDDWWAECAAIGRCVDLGSPCPVTRPLVDGTQAVWCSSSAQREECRHTWWPSVCSESISDYGCGEELTGVCAYGQNDLLIGIKPESVRSTGAWCPGSFCATH
ncbi:MAG: hypothetical protein DWH96_00020 [Planctomycetota bacterium]|nr:MAG: hypothetical protein DWH96_00020 [Planctomycetota bacterium]RLS91877.1 MAG: hypothetical protein DWI11_10220 [Planctomycetota bacterium]